MIEAKGKGAATGLSMPFFKENNGPKEKQMEFRPCIDIHNGKVKQIVGSSLKDQGSSASENFVAEQDAAFFAELYRSKGIRGGHVILLNPPGSEYYEATRDQAFAALAAYPGGLQIGGGITADNASAFIEGGASAVIVTSYVFRDGRIDYENLDRLVQTVGKEHLVLDLSCRYRKDAAHGAGYYIVTDRWQKYTDERVTEEVLTKLSAYCCEFLIHAVDVEGKANGIEKPLVRLLGDWGQIPVTYAGGVHSFEDLSEIAQLGRGRLHVTIGSALDLFGGPMSFEQVIAYIKERSV
jgi:phosphoribosylformimino-5-aminoimidazole carboxamide ribotide isomerase